MPKLINRLKKFESFHAQNPDFDILSFDFHDREQLAGLNWTGSDRIHQFHELQVYQRLLRVLLPTVNRTGNGEDLTEEQISQAEGWVENLREAGFDSAHRIAEIPEHRFRHEYAALFGGNEELTRRVHQRASAVKAQIQHLVANLHGMMGSSHYRQIRAYNSDPQLESYYEGIPSYQDFFGSLDYLKSGRNVSIFDPAAYFLDLMRVTDEYITYPNWESIPTGLKLKERRPDLFELKLTKDNTENTVPYIQIVNNVLERYLGRYTEITGPVIQATQDTVTLDQAASDQKGKYVGLYIFIITGPGTGQNRKIIGYDGATRTATVGSMWAQQPNKYSTYEITDMVNNATVDSVGLGITASNTQDAFNGKYISITHGSGLGQIRRITQYHGKNRTAIVDRYWQTLPDKTSAYIISDDPYQTLAISPYPFNLPFNLPLTEVRCYVRSLDRTLAGIFFEFNPPVTGGTAAGGAINSIILSPDTVNSNLINPTMQIALIAGAGAGQVRNILDYNQDSKTVIVDFPWSIVPDSGTQFHILDRFGADLEFLELSCEEYHNVTTIQTDLQKIAAFYGYASLSSPDVLAPVEVFMGRTGLSYDRLQELLTQNLSAQELENNQADEFFINKTGEGLPYMRIVLDQIDPSQPYYKIANLSINRLDRMNRFIRLAVKLNWNFADLDWAMVSINASEITEQTVKTLAALKRLQNLTGLKVDELCGLWHDLKTIDKGNNRNPEDLFDRIFNNPTVLNGQDPYTSNTLIPFDPDPDRCLTWNIIDNTDMNATIRGRLRAALRINDNDLTLLGKYVCALLTQSVSSNPQLEMTLDNLSRMYRINQGANSSSLNIDQYLVLLHLLYYPKVSYLTPPDNLPASSPKEILYLRHNVEWLKQSTFNIYELQYILTGEISPYYNPGYKTGDIAPWMENMATEAAGTCLTPASFTNANIDMKISAEIFQKLNDQSLITDTGVVSNDQTKYLAAAALWPINDLSFVTPKDDLKLPVKITEPESKQVYQQLLQSYPPVLKTLNTEPETAMLAEFFNQAVNLDYLFAGDPEADNKINQVRVFLLETMTNIRCSEFAGLLPGFTEQDIASVVDVFVKARNLQQEAVLKGLAGFLHTSPERLAGIVPWAAGVDFASYVAYILTPLYKGQVPDNIPPFIALLSRAIILFDRLGFNAMEIAAVIENPDAFSIQPALNLAFENVVLLWQYKSLTRIFPDQNGALINYLKLPGDMNVKVAALAELTHWDEDQIKILIARFWPASFGASQYGYNTVAGLWRLQECFDVSQKTGMDMTSLVALNRLNNLPLADVNGKLIPTNWTFYNDQAEIVQTAVKSKYHGEQAAAVNQTITGYLDTRKRDALLGYTIWTVNQQFPVVQKPSDLYQFLLVDVEMSDADRISPIAQGIASLQLYMQRCRMMLEPGVTVLSNIPDVWWEWLDNYRIWEANRKVFLYPENYLEPALRSNQTPEFKKFAEALTQTNINEEKVSEAFTGYFQDVSVLASLVFCDAYDHQLLQPDSPPCNFQYYFGRTNTQPYTFYYRKWLDLKSWTNWQKIDLSINAEFISPVYAFNTLFIFWIEIDHTQNSAYKETDSQDTVPTVYDIAVIKYSFLNSNEEWADPQTINQKIIIDYQEDYKNDPYDTISYSGSPDKIYCKKVYPLYVPEANPTDPQGYPNGENIFLVYGYYKTVGAKAIDIDEPDSQLNPIKKQFETEVYDFSQRFNNAVAKSMSNDKMLFHNFCQTVNLDAYPLNTVILPDTNPLVVMAGIDKVYSKLGIMNANSTGIILTNYIYDQCKDIIILPIQIPIITSYSLLNKISRNTSSLITVKNIPGHFIFNNGDEAFLFVSQQTNIKSISNILTATPDSNSSEFLLSVGQYTDSAKKFEELQFQFYRLSTNVINPLKQKLQAGGIARLLTIESQETQELPFSRLSPTDKVIAPPAQSIFNGAYGMYYWEIFFHAPFLVADILRTHKRFDEARKWYQYIFNPTQSLEAGLSNENDRYWRFLPFRGMALPSLTEILTNPAQIIAYNDNPFDPDAIARLRPSAYMKAIVMRYIDNLLAWADNLFARDTRESITQATNLYVMAADLLGPKPKAVGEEPVPPAKNYNEISQSYFEIEVSGSVVKAYPYNVTLDSNASDVAGAYTGMYISITAGTGSGQTAYLIIHYENRIATLEKAWQTIPQSDSIYNILTYRVPQFLIQLENTALMGESHKAGVCLASPAFNDIDSYFTIPENSELIAYWEQVEDRLYKIRHSMNIQGEFRILEQFEPPVDVRQLIKATAGGKDVLETVNAASLQIPYYRFPVMLEKAKSLTAAVMQLGASLLSALEKQDAEELALLSATQEKAILNLTTYIKEQQLNEAIQTQSAVKESLKSAQYRLDHFNGLLEKGLSAGEILNIEFMTVAMIANSVAGTIGTLAATAYAVPQVGSPFAMTYGGQQLGSSLMAVKEAAQVYAMVFNYLSQLSQTMASYQRRAEEWQLQATLASYDVTQVNYQLAAAEIRQQISRRELEIHQATMDQNAEKEAFFRNKFTNRELYQWMVEQLSNVYFHTYNIAFDLAQSALRAYQFELNTDQTFLNLGSWDDLKKGLLAGESLMLSLNQIEKAYLDNNPRTLEIEKTISLVQLDPQALMDLKITGECEFALTEKLFDNDYPGHYTRKIKTISISIPAVVGPYQNIKATLTQTSNATIIKPDTGAVNYLLGNTQTAPGTDVMRSNWWLNQQIAISRGTDDAGLFQLNFNDERYLPFEGTGAVSNWHLSLPPSTNLFNFNAISDVIIHLRYTAIDGGTDFKEQVMGLDGMNLYAGYDTYLMAQDFSQEWYTFLHEHPSTESQVLNFNLANLAPPNLKNTKLTGFYFKLDLPEGINPTGNSNYLTFQVTKQMPVSFNLDANGTYTDIFGTAITLAEANGSRSITFNLGDTPPGLKTITNPAYLDPAVIRNIVLVLFYQGEKE